MQHNKHIMHCTILSNKRPKRENTEIARFFQLILFAIRTKLFATPFGP